MDIKKYGDLSENEKNIIDRLISGMRKGNHFFKAKYIGDEIGLSPKKVGYRLSDLSNYRVEMDSGGVIIIERYSYTKTTNWRVNILERSCQPMN